MCHKVWVGKAIRNIGNLSFKRLFSFHYGTAGYMISRSGAESIIQSLNEFDMPADDIIFLKMLSDKHYGKYLQLDPACCTQEFLVNDNNESDIYEGREKRLGKDIAGTRIKTKEKRLFRKVLRDYKRLKKQIVFTFFRFFKILSRSYCAIDFKE